jgi:ankyrin repeat protein
MQISSGLPGSSQFVTGSGFKQSNYCQIAKCENVDSFKKVHSLQFVGKGEEWFQAAIKGDGPKITKLLKDGIEAGRADSYGNTALHLAAANGRDHLVRQLTNVDARLVHSVNRDGDTPLHLAAANGNLGSAKILESKGANTEKKNNEQNTPLHLAAANGHENMVRWLAEKDPRTMRITNRHGDLPIHLAANHGNMESALILVEKGSKVAQPNNQGKTVMDLARASRGLAGIAPYRDRFMAARATARQNGVIVISPDGFDYDEDNIHIGCHCG